MKPVVGEGARLDEILDGTTIMVRKTREGFVMEATGRGLVGSKTLGDFIPAFVGADKFASRILDAMTSAARGNGDNPDPAAILTEAYGRGRGKPRPVTASTTVNAEVHLDRTALSWEELREGFLRDHQCLTAPELAELTGSRSRNPSSRVHEWLRAGKVFAVYDGASARFPLFQIDTDEGRPRREIRDALGHLREKLSDWQIAFWFVTANTWTGDWRRPLDLLGREPERIVEAARNEVATEFL